jgi:hypothetical protein
MYICMAVVESSWNVMAHGDAREGKWRGNWRMEWIASTLHTTSEHDVSNITTADAHNSAASSRLNWRPRRFKWTRPFRRKRKYGFCAMPSHFKRSLTPNLGWTQCLQDGRYPDCLLSQLNVEPGIPLARCFVRTVVLMTIRVLWDFTPCRLANIYQPFGA